VIPVPPYDGRMSTAEDATQPPSWWDDRDAPPSAVDPSPPVIDPSCYRVLGEHGRGGLGRVLRAQDLRTGRVVAIKEVLRDSPQALRRFRREALVTANLQHPAIVPVYEVGQWPDGQPFYAMKLVDGVALADAIRDAATAIERLALVPHVIQVADALAYAHDRGWIHRDLKPGNVLVSGFGETVIIDWGLAKRVTAAADAGGDGETAADAHADAATLAGQVVGTPAYMPPEQARGEALDPRADVYAIGALLYHVVAGVPPYHGCATAGDVIAAIDAGPPRPLGELARDLPSELIAIVGRAMAYRPDDRYPSARELAADLGRFRAGSLVAAHVYTPWQLVRRWVRRHRAAVAVAAVAVVTLAGDGAVALRENLRARDRAERARGEAEARVAALHTELGLRELAAGSPARALPYLADARTKASGDPLVGFLLARALESQARLEVAIETGTVVGFSFGGAGGGAGGSMRVLPLSPAPGRVIDLTGRTVGATPALGRYAALAPDGSWLVAGEPGAVVAREVVGGAERARRAAEAPPRWIAIDAGGGVITVDERGGVTASGADLAATASAQVPFAPYDAIARGDRLVVVGRAGEVWAWNRAGGAATGARLAAPHQDKVSGLCASADAAVWMTMDRTATVVWRGDREVARVAHDGLAGGCAIDRAGAIAVTSVDGAGVVVWDLSAAVPAPGPTVRAGRGAVPNNRDTPALSGDGALIAIGDHLGYVEVFDAQTGSSLDRRLGHDAPAERLEFSPDGKHLVTATVGGDVRAWRVGGGGGDGLVTFPLGARGYGGAFLDAGRAVVSGTTATQLVGVDGRVHGELIGHTGEVTAIDVASSTGLVATASHDRTARLWRADGTAVATLPGGGADRVSRVAIARDGSRVLTATLDGVATTWRPDGTREHQLTTPGPMFTARLSPDGRRAITLHDGSATGTLWDADTGARLAELTANGTQAVDARFSADGALVAIPAAGLALTVLDGRTGAPRFEVEHEAPALATAWSADGALLATSDMAGTIHLTGRDGARVRSLRVDRAVTALAFHPAGDLLAVATEDGVVRVHEVARGRELVRRSRPVFASSLVFAPDGDHLLIPGGPDVPVAIWRLDRDPGTDVEVARRLRCAVPFRLDGASGLVAAVTDPAACR
jgi:WD40 repeat protein